jgi:hypothetical protein
MVVALPHKERNRTSHLETGGSDQGETGMDDRNSTCAGVDLGGTKIAIAIGTAAGEILA